jgi:SepF-like predicted cell division protein (DUF552 family)
MAFWAGVAAGVEAKQKERIAEEETAYRRSRDEEADAYRDMVFEYNKNRDKETNDLRVLQATASFYAALPPQLARELAGNISSNDVSPESNPKKINNLKKSMTVPVITATQAKFNGIIKGLNVEDGSKEDLFYKSARTDPQAQVTIISFLEEQAKKGNVVALEDVPKYMKIVGETKGSDINDIKELMSSVGSGDTIINDITALTKATIMAYSYVPDQVLLLQTGAPISDTRQKTQFQNTITRLTNLATLKSGQGSKDAADALLMLENPEGAVQSQGMAKIIKTFPKESSEIIDENADVNPLVKDLKALLPSTEENTIKVLDVNQKKIHDANVTNGLVYNSKKELEDALPNLDSGLKVYYRSENGVFKPFVVPPRENTTETRSVKFSKGGLADDMDTEPMEENTEMRPVDQAQEQFSEFGLKMPTNDKELEAYKQTLVTVKELINPNMDTSVLKELTDRAIQNVEAIRNG